MTAQQDAAQWARAHTIGETLDYPSLVWLAASEVVHGATLSHDGESITTAGGRFAFEVVPKIELNRSYYNEASVAFLAERALTMRGLLREGRFTARTLWPDDFRLDQTADSREIEPTGLALRALVREEPRGGAQSAFKAITLWERDPALRDWRDKPVLAAVLNGAQGDDDEAHGGHFALATGYVGRDGAIGDWLTNNFYTLDSFSEKGIIAAMLPLDNYLGDLNSGQAWYRPSYVLAAVLRNARGAIHIQSALARAYNQFYRHQLVYRHATMNCASISVDVLRALGWNVRDRGPTSQVLAAISVPYTLVRQRSADKAASVYDYLAEDRTRLLPAGAFEEIGADLLGLASGKLPRTPSDFEARLAEDIEALVFLRVPQFPSSRAWGDYPVASFWEYQRRLPGDPAQQKIIPVPPRLFPERLLDRDLLPPPRARGEIAVSLWALLSIVGIPWLIQRWWRRSRGHDKLSIRTDVAQSAEGGPDAK